MKRLFLYCLATLFISACGFHLRGSVNAPTWLNNVKIVVQDGNKEFLYPLQSLLNAYHIKTTDDADQANYWLVIVHSGHTQQISSVGSGSNPRQYQLYFSADYLLQTPKGKIIQPLSHVTVTRQLTINNDRILGSDEEGALTLSEMRKDAAIQVINRLSRHTPPE